jgi:tRNA (guanine-N7-)-methyltransferase
VEVRKSKKLSLDELQPYMVELPPQRGPEPPPLPRLDWQSLFQNSHPVEVEVGFGKGLFLQTESLAHPERNYFGIEIIRKYQLFATTRLALRQRQNVRTCCGDAKIVLEQMIPAGSVAAVHIFFPDPWWKNRHKKRLLMTPEFVELILRVLEPDGRLFFVTDVQDYFEMVVQMLTTFPAFVPLPPRPATEGRTDHDFLTSFERKFRREGRPIYRSAYQKTSQTHG